MSEISTIKPIRENIPLVAPVQVAEIIHEAQAHGSDSAQTLLLAKLAISRLGALPIVTATMLTHALEHLTGELPQLPQIATPLLSILQRMQEQTTTFLDRSLMLAVRQSSPDNPSFFYALRDFIVLTANLPKSERAHAAALAMITLIENQLVINLHALTAGLPLRMFVPIPRNGKYEIEELSYEISSDNARRLHHFWLKLQTKTMGDVTVSGAELESRLQIAFHTQTPESALRLHNNFQHLRDKLERKNYTIMGLNASSGKQTEKHGSSPNSRISIST